jgi:hypothetical protein
MPQSRRRADSEQPGADRTRNRGTAQYLWKGHGLAGRTTGSLNARHARLVVGASATSPRSSPTRTTTLDRRAGDYRLRMSASVPKFEEIVARCARLQLAAAPVAAPIVASESSICSVDQARSGLKMGVWSPADVVLPWFCEAVSESGAESCAVGLSVSP